MRGCAACACAAWRPSVPPSSCPWPSGFPPDALRHSSALDTSFVEAHGAGGGDKAGPGIVGQRDALGGALGAIVHFLLAGHEDFLAGGHRLGGLHEVGVAVDLGSEEAAG